MSLLSHVHKIMSKPLTLESRAALARLGKCGSNSTTSSTAPHHSFSASNYNPLVPLSRRAAVLVLLFKEGGTGDLRVVVTMRGAGMRACKFVLVVLVSSSELAGGSAGYKGSSESERRLLKCETWWAHCVVWHPGELLCPDCCIKVPDGQYPILHTHYPGLLLRPTISSGYLTLDAF